MIRFLNKLSKGVRLDRVQSSALGSWLRSVEGLCVQLLSLLNNMDSGYNIENILVS